MKHCIEMYAYPTILCRIIHFLFGLT